MNIVVEIIGIIATILIAVSMLVKTTNIKGSIFMRSVNALGSVIFVVYGILLPAISTAILNGALIIVNVYHLVILIKEYKETKLVDSNNIESESK